MLPKREWGDEPLDAAGEDPAREPDPKPELELIARRPDWESHAICGGMYEVFDLAEVDHYNVDARRDNNHRLEVARGVCFDCPVFRECWEDAFLKLPIGVIRAGAKLNNAFAMSRRKALEQSMIRYEHHKRREAERARRRVPRRKRRTGRGGKPADG